MKNRYKIDKFCVLILSLGILISCTYKRSKSAESKRSKSIVRIVPDVDSAFNKNNAQNVVSDIFIDEEASVQEDRQVQEKVLPDLNKNWQASRVDVEKKSKISAIHFMDEKNGWAYSKKNGIYRTYDSGKTWISYEVDFDKKWHVSSFVFTDELNGWVILQHYGEGSYPSKFSKDEVKVYSSADGGKTWKLSLAEKSTSGASIYGDGANVWFETGRFIGYRPLRTEPVISYFSKADEKWQDVSEPLKKISYDSRFIEGSTPSIMGFTIGKNGCVLVVNNVGKIFQSCDKGVTWEYLKTLKSASDPQWNAIRQLKANNDYLCDGYLWVNDSAGGYHHGASTQITVLTADIKKISKVLGLSGYFSSQSFSVSPNEFYLTSQKFDFDDKNPKYKGLILQTKDGGKIWEKIFRSPKPIKFAQFFPSEVSMFWILTADEKLYRLEKVK